MKTSVDTSVLPDSLIDAVWRMSPATAQEALRQMEGKPADEIVGVLLQLLQRRSAA